MTTQAQARATNKYRQKLITKQININPAKHPEVAKFVENEAYNGAFSPFIVELIQQHIDNNTASIDIDTQDKPSENTQ